jgi:hypothetical protein
VDGEVLALTDALPDGEVPGEPVGVGVGVGQGGRGFGVATVSTIGVLVGTELP